MAIFCMRRAYNENWSFTYNQRVHFQMRSYHDLLPYLNHMERKCCFYDEVLCQFFARENWFFTYLLRLPLQFQWGPWHKLNNIKRDFGCYFDEARCQFIAYDEHTMKIDLLLLFTVRVSIPESVSKWWWSLTWIT